MAVCEVGFPIVLTLTLVVTILFGTEERKERVFWLLRSLMDKDKPEPPSPPEPLAPRAESQAADRNTHWGPRKRT